MTWAVIRVRGTVNINADIKDTMRMLRLNKVNHCILVPETGVYRGMLQKVKDYVTWGEVASETLAKLLHRYGRVGGKSVTDHHFKDFSEHKSLIAFSKAVCEGRESFKNLKGLNPVLRLHPPLKGYEGVKNPYRSGGALGYRGADINALLERMMPPAKEREEKPARVQEKPAEKKAEKAHAEKKAKKKSKGED